MEDQNLIRLSALIKDQRDELLARWRQQVPQLPAAAKLDLPTINDLVPELLDNLTDSLKPQNETRETNAISAEHGVLRWQAGFDVMMTIELQRRLERFDRFSIHRLTSDCLPCLASCNKRPIVISKTSKSGGL